MSLSKGKKSQIRTAFKKVHGVSDLSDQQLIRYGEEIIFHVDKYPFEDDKLLSFRLGSIADLSDSDKILEYLAKIPEKDFSTTENSTYGKLFELGNQFNIGYSAGGTAVGKEDKQETKEVSNNESNDEVGKDEITGMEELGDLEDETKSVESTPEVTEEVETINTKNNEEETKMSTNAIDKLQQEAQNIGVGNELETTNVSQVSKNDKLAAKRIVEETQVDRINYSKNAKVEKVLITQIDRVEKATQGRASMGRVSNPRKALETFISKTGCSVEEGVVKFSKLHDSELHDNAVKMYNLLTEAVNNPEIEVQPYFGKEDATVPVSIKGIVIHDPSGKEMVVAQRDIAAHILQHAFLYLDVESTSNAQFQLDAATPRAGKAPKKSYVVRVANKSDLIEDTNATLLVKNITKEVSESKTGYRSALSVSCNSNRLDAQGNPRKTTWRIPLEVEQYEVEIVEKYSDLFRSGVGNSVKPIKAETEADISNIVDKITTMIAAEASKSSDKTIIGANMLAEFNEEKSDIVADEAKSVNEALGGEDFDETEFEG